MTDAPAFRSSGDLLADRRYAYAAALMAEGDARAAADLFEQATEIAPRWAAAWFGLAQAQEGLGELEAAAAAYARARDCDAEDELGAGLRLALLTGDTPAGPPLSYVRGLFDQYAPRFERHLREDLAYRGPELLMQALAEVCAARGRAFRFGRVLDLGCGTGLMGRFLQAQAGAIHGVDLAPRMIEATRATGAYAHAEAGDLQSFLEAQDEASACLITAADVFVYLGDLAPAFRAGARALKRGGLFAFTLQSTQAGDFILGADMRFAHSAAYIRRIAAQAGLDMALLIEASKRKDAGRDVPGLVAVLARP